VSPGDASTDADDESSSGGTSSPDRSAPSVHGSAVTDTGHGTGPGAEDDQPVITIEALLEDLERVTAERDTYLDEARRIAAEFANYRKQTDKRHVEVVEQAAAKLVQQLLPVLDACDGAIAHGALDVEPILQALLGTLEKSGLSRIGEAGEPFDPTHHEAVMHEDGDGGDAVVSDLFRAGYAWNGRVVRPAMVKVRG
jgi:molecular chaperone GrpE